MGQHSEKHLDAAGKREAESSLEKVARLEDQVAALAADLQKERERTADRSLFLAGTSREIGIPMKGIIGMVEFLQSTGLTAEQRERLGAVRQSAESTLRLINDLGEISRIEAGELDIEQIPFGLRECIGGTLDTLLVKADEKRLVLACHIDPSLPDNIVGDPERVRQILIHLVENAIRFTERGEVVVRIDRAAPEEIQSIYPDKAEIRLQFTVSDTGSGITRTRQKSIFNAYSRADGSVTGRSGGRRLGLPISSQMVKLMGGRIWLESREGYGSIFRFTARFGLGEEVTAESPPSDPAILENLPVLVVDDNAMNRRVLEKMLSSLRMRPMSAQSASTALAALSRAEQAGDPFALALIDLTMPGMDGFSLVERIRERPGLRDTPIIMLTSAVQQGEAARFARLGIEVSLVKPVRQTELFHGVLDALGQMPETTLRVLLAESSKINQRIIAGLLEKRGHFVSVVSTGQEMLAFLENEPFDMALIELEMPGMSGLEAVEAIRTREKLSGISLPLVAVTARPLSECLDDCLEAGMAGCVAKPVTPALLYDTVDDVLRRGEQVGVDVS